MAAKTLLQRVLDLAGQFVIQQKGQWDHVQWEGFLEKAAALGIGLTDETKRSLGNILESCRCFYSGETLAPAPRITPAKPKK
jgi:hypothetical protein